MCFNFMYVTPPPTERYCSDRQEMVADVAYEAGECMEGTGVETPALVHGGFVVNDPPELAGGEFVDGVYELSDFKIWRDSADIPIGTLDIEESTILAKGQLVVAGDEFVVDIVSETHIVTDDVEVEQGNDSSVRARVTGVEGARLSALLVCPDEEDSVWDFESVDGTVVLGFQGSAFGVNFDVRQTFQKVEP
jgi:hypothetical protein